MVNVEKFLIEKHELQSFQRRRTLWEIACLSRILYKMCDSQCQLWQSLGGYTSPIFKCSAAQRVLLILYWCTWFPSPRYRTSHLLLLNLSFSSFGLRFQFLRMILGQASKLLGVSFHFSFKHWEPTWTYWLGPRVDSGDLYLIHSLYPRANH